MITSSEKIVTIQLSEQEALQILKEGEKLFTLSKNIEDFKTILSLKDSIAMEF